METRTTWRKELAYEMKAMSDDGPVMTYAPDEATFDIDFNAGYGGPEGPSVLAWTDQRVYFPVCYDGAEDIGSAPRNPVDEGQEHVGGG